MLDALVAKLLGLTGLWSQYTPTLTPDRLRGLVRLGEGAIRVTPEDAAKLFDELTLVSKLLFVFGTGLTALLIWCFPGTTFRLWHKQYWSLFVLEELRNVCQCFDPQLDGLYCQACGRLRRPSGQLVSWETCMQRSAELDDRLARLSAGAA